MSLVLTESFAVAVQSIVHTFRYMTKHLYGLCYSPRRASQCVESRDLLACRDSETEVPSSRHSGHVKNGDFYTLSTSSLTESAEPRLGRNDFERGSAMFLHGPALSGIRLNSRARTMAYQAQPPSTRPRWRSGAPHISGGPRRMHSRGRAS